MTDLRDARIAKGLTQTGLAKLAGTSQPQIKRLEKGDRKLTREWAERLAPFLDVTPAELVFDAVRTARGKAQSAFPPLDPELQKAWVANFRSLGIEDTAATAAARELLAFLGGYKAPPPGSTLPEVATKILEDLMRKRAAKSSGKQSRSGR